MSNEELRALIWGLFVDLAYATNRLGNMFGEMYAICLEHSYILGLLRGSMKRARDYTYNMAGVFIDIGYGIVEIVARLGVALTLEGFSDFIVEHFPDLIGLFQDPVRFVLTQLTLAWGLDPWHTQSIEFLAKHIFETYFPTLYHFWLDPELWLHNLVDPLFAQIWEVLEGAVVVTWEWLLDQYEEAFESIGDRLYSLAERTIRYFWEGIWQE